MGVALAGRRRWIWLAVAVVVLALLAFGVVRALTAGAAREESAAAETVGADKGAVTTEVATTGTLQAAQTRSLSFAVSAEVETVKVRAGNTVTAGQVLATVDDTDAAEKVDDATTALSDAYDALEDEYMLARAIIEARVKSGLTQEELAKQMGTTQSVVARWESGKTLPSCRTLLRLAKATGTRFHAQFVTR